MKRAEEEEDDKPPASPQSEGGISGKGDEQDGEIEGKPPPKKARAASQTSEKGKVHLANPGSEESAAQGQDSGARLFDFTSPHREQQLDNQGQSRNMTEEPSGSESKSLTAHEAKAPTRSLTSMEFPAQLMDLLQRNSAPDALWFLQGGEAIGINMNAVDRVLKEHFRSMKSTSLVRNLNRWGFRRISHPSLKDNERGYHHLLFQRDKPHLVHRMKKDSNAKEVVRQLDLDEGKAEAQSDDAQNEDASQQEDSAAQSDAERGVSSSAFAAPAGQYTYGQGAGQAMSSSWMPQNQPGAFSVVFASQQQQLLLQGLAAQQRFEWQRQQSAYPHQFGATMPSAWGNHMGNWNMQQTLPFASHFASGFPRGMQETTASRPMPQIGFPGHTTTTSTGNVVAQIGGDFPAASDVSRRANRENDEDEGDQNDAEEEQ